MQSSPDAVIQSPPARFGPLYRSLIVNVALPLIAVQVLLHRGMPAVPALAIAAVFPFADALRELVRARRIAPLPALSLAAIVFGIATSFVSGNPAFAVAKESVITAVVGLAFLGSIAAGRPLIFQFAKDFSAGDERAGRARWDALWEIEGFRRSMRFITAVWGIGLLIEAAARIVVAFALPPATSTIVSPLLAIVAFGALIAWTTSYSRALRNRAAAAGVATP
ncbi:MAG TPA: VC0807 family protein [Candidatus Elarobacter sp.]|nr:VC0807 family protein [Candidatus Elarobacter sp.]